MATAVPKGHKPTLSKPIKKPLISRTNQTISSSSLNGKDGNESATMVTGTNKKPGVTATARQTSRGSAVNDINGGGASSAAAAALPSSSHDRSAQAHSRVSKASTGAMSNKSDSTMANKSSITTMSNDNGDNKHAPQSKHHVKIATGVAKQRKVIGNMVDKNSNNIDSRPNLTKHNSRGSGENDAGDIMKMIDEIEAVPLDSDKGKGKKPVINGKSVNAGKAALASKYGRTISSKALKPPKKDKPDIKKAVPRSDKVTSSVAISGAISGSSGSSRVSTGSRNSVNSSSSLQSSSSQKSLAEKISERRCFLNIDISTDSSASRSVSSCLSGQSDDISSGTGSPVLYSKASTSPNKRGDTNTDSVNGDALRKHLPDITIMEGENSFPIIKRKVLRRIIEG